MFPTEFEQPTLRDLLDDPLIQMVMESDAVTRDDVRMLFDHLRSDRNERIDQPA